MENIPVFGIVFGVGAAIAGVLLVLIVIGWVARRKAGPVNPRAKSADDGSAAALAVASIATFGGDGGASCGSDGGGGSCS